MALYLDLSPGEGIAIDSGRILVIVQPKNGKRTRLRIDAARSIPIIKIGNSSTAPCGAGIDGNTAT